MVENLCVVLLCFCAVFDNWRMIVNLRHLFFCQTDLRLVVVQLSSRIEVRSCILECGAVEV